MAYGGVGWRMVAMGGVGCRLIDSRSSPESVQDSSGWRRFILDI